MVVRAFDKELLVAVELPRNPGDDVGLLHLRQRIADGGEVEPTKLESRRRRKRIRRRARFRRRTDVWDRRIAGTAEAAGLKDVGGKRPRRRSIDPKRWNVGGLRAATL